MDLRAHRKAIRTEINGFMVAPVPDEMHGLVTTYVGWFCRCDRCNEANNIYGNNARKTRRASRVLRDGRLFAVQASSHGNYSTYVNWSCRCDPCTDANTDRARRYR